MFRMSKRTSKNKASTACAPTKDQMDRFSKNAEKWGFNLDFDALRDDLTDYFRKMPVLSSVTQENLADGVIAIVRKHYRKNQ